MMNNLKTALSAAAILLASCTSSPNLWYKAGATQHDFNLDSRECEIIAEKFALQQSETGKSIDPANFSRHYLQCINDKGWSRNRPVADRTADHPAVPSNPLNIRHDGSSLHGFGRQVALPENFTLLKNRLTSLKPTIMQQFLWGNEDNTFISIIFQRNDATRFDITPYPLAEPYRLYTSKTGNNTGDLLQWSAFFGQIQTEWVMGVGSYYLTNKTERIIIVITRKLDPPAAAPPANLALSRNQHEQIEAFSSRWVAWLESQFPEQKTWKDRLPAYFMTLFDKMFNAS
ncbi:MAG: hypothetical protein KKG47_02980 [Proteobacteria bacterium]|nr:hypothetical protein [Pseudomonadota bacterium]MBU1738857.1 hypothetical protein [Pseudomonadota bacterium]